MEFGESDEVVWLDAVPNKSLSQFCVLRVATEDFLMLPIPKQMLISLPFFKEEMMIGCKHISTFSSGLY